MCNHDTGRTIGIISARSDPAKAKFAEGVLNMYPGSVFTYYGEEIGMVGSSNDPNKRIAMNWSETERTNPPPGADKLEYPYPGVYEQQANEDSLLNYCRSINELKHTYPVIMQGRTEELVTAESYCALRRYTDSDECVIVINFDPESSASFDIPGSFTLAGELKTSGDGAAADVFNAVTSITVPPYGIAILLPQEG